MSHFKTESWLISASAHALALLRKKNNWWSSSSFSAKGRFCAESNLMSSFCHHQKKLSQGHCASIIFCFTKKPFYLKDADDLRYPEILLSGPFSLVSSAKKRRKRNCNNNSCYLGSVPLHSVTMTLDASQHRSASKWRNDTERQSGASLHSDKMTHLYSASK